jgi:5-methylcytosine-specific restriction endonuclease McrA
MEKFWMRFDCFIFMTYSEKLRDPRWQRKRLEILQRDNWACLSCGTKTKSLQVHHVAYRKIEPWDYPDDLYQTLCEDCHKLRGQITDKIVDDLRVDLKEVTTDRLEVVYKKIATVLYNEGLRTDFFKAQKTQL